MIKTLQNHLTTMTDIKKAIKRPVDNRAFSNSPEAAFINGFQ